MWKLNAARAGKPPADPGDVPLGLRAVVLRHLAGSHVFHRCAGSTTWSSTLTIFGISTGTTVSRAAVAVTPSLHPSKSDDPSDYRAAGLRPDSGPRPPRRPGQRGGDQVALEDPVEAGVPVEARRVAGAVHGDEPAGPELPGQPSAHTTGVAGSPVVPTTTIGGAVGARTAVGVGFTGGTGQYAHGHAEPEVRRAEDRRLAGGLGLERGQRRPASSSGPSDAGDREERGPLGRVPARRVSAGRRSRRGRRARPGCRRRLRSMRRRAPRSRSAPR